MMPFFVPRFLECCACQHMPFFSSWILQKHAFFMVPFFVPCFFNISRVQTYAYFRAARFCQSMLRLKTYSFFSSWVLQKSVFSMVSFVCFSLFSMLHLQTYVFFLSSSVFPKHVAPADICVFSAAGFCKSVFFS